MEIELTGLKKLFRQRAWIAGLLLVPILLALGWLGTRYTAADEDGYPVLLSWAEWQIVQARQVYAVELGDLRSEAASLVNLLNQDPDPVRAQITAERIAHTYDTGQPALARQRALLIEAAGAVQDWAAGALPLEQAQAATQQAVLSLDPGVEQP